MSMVDAQQQQVPGADRTTGVQLTQSDLAARVGEAARAEGKDVMKETKAELRERAAERAQGSGLHDEWGEKCPLEETGAEVFARWRGEVVDEAYEG